MEERQSELDGFKIPPHRIFQGELEGVRNLASSWLWKVVNIGQRASVQAGQ